MTPSCFFCYTEAMFIRKAEKKDIPSCLKIYDAARSHMRAEGNIRQWINGYPSKTILEKDVEEGVLYLIEDDGLCHGVFMCKMGPDPTYSKIYDGSWPDDSEYAVIHRIAGDGKVKGILKEAAAFASSMAPSIRIDTHEDNISMQKALEKRMGQSGGLIRKKVIKHLCSV